MDIERLLTPHSISDQSLKYSFKVKELAWSSKDDWLPTVSLTRVSGTVLKLKS